MKMISSNPKRLPLLFGVMIFLLATLDAQVTNGQVAGKDFVPGEILLKFRQPLSGQQLSGFLMANGLQLKKRISISGEIFLLEAPGVTNINPKVDSLIANSFVDFAEPNFYGYLHATPRDQYYSQQWGLTQIQAPSAWDIQKGSSSIVIGIVDSGVDWDHPDLDGNIWSNVNEIAGNGIDDDHNGFIDDIRGWDSAGNFSCSSPEDNDPMDFSGHGTHVAGIAAAQTDNYENGQYIGIAGVCWYCKIMPVKISNNLCESQDSTTSDGLTTAANVAQGVNYAANNGARVINMSLGLRWFSSTLQSAIFYATNTKGCIIICTAGNTGPTFNLLEYPAAWSNLYPGLISVAATNSSDLVASYSTRRNTNEVAAPGGTNIVPPHNANDVYSTILDNTYTYTAGTSMAAPHVAGLAALILSSDPDLTNSQVEQLIKDTVDPKGSPPYPNIEYGYGRINAYKALLATPKPPSISTLFSASDGGTGAKLTWANPSFTNFSGVLLARVTNTSSWKPTQGIAPQNQNPTAGVRLYYGMGTNYNDTGLTQGTTYYYKLFAYNNNYAYSIVTDFTATPHKTATTSTVATAYNNQRKMVYDGTNYHMVYETGGEIYYTFSNDNGAYWSNELLISDGNGGNKYPSLDIINGIIVVVWQQEFPSTGKICMRRKTAGGWQTQQEVASFLASSGFTATPVVAAYSAPYYFIIWHDYDNNNLTIRSYNETSGTFGTETAIPSTNSNSLYPSLATDTNTKLHLAWAESGQIYYTKINHSGGGNYTFSPSKENVSSGTGYYDHVYPSITTDYSRRANVAWQAYSGPALETQIILHRRRELSDVWSSATSFAGNDEYHKPSITSYPNVSNNQKLRIAWQLLPTSLKLGKYDGSSWTVLTESATGHNPNISANFTGSEAAKIVLRSGSASPYTVTTTSQNLPKTTTTSIAHHRRGVKQLGKVELAFDVGDFLLQAGGKIPIDLFAYNDTLAVGHTGVWNDMFRTDPIIWPANNGLEFQNGFSVVNPNLIGGVLPPGTAVIFALEAINATTNTPLASLYQQVVNSANILPFQGKRQVPTPANLAGQQIYLRVAVQTQGAIVAKPSLVEIYHEAPDSSNLGKPEPADGAGLPKIFTLYPNYPNPFNPETAIRFYLSEASEIELTVFNIVGETVKTLMSGRRTAGSHTEIWNGRNDRGELAASGVYFLQMRARDFKAVQKMILTR